LGKSVSQENNRKIENLYGEGKNRHSCFCMESSFYMDIYGKQEIWECLILKEAILGMFGSFFRAKISWEERLWAYEKYSVRKLSREASVLLLCESLLPL
jgi:hypothetical protein